MAKHPTPKDNPYRVKALQPGLYDGHRRQGEVFPLLRRADFSARWMEPVGWDPDKPEGAAGA